MADPSLQRIVVDPGQLKALIGTYETAERHIGEVANNVFNNARMSASWTNDQVSLGMTAYYNSAVIDDPQSTYSAIVRYQHEHGNAIAALKAMLASYERAESEIASTLQ